MSVAARLEAIQAQHFLFTEQRRIDALVERIRGRLARSQPVSRDLARAERLCEQSAQNLADRRRCIPQTIHFDDQLPISAEREKVAQMLSAHQVLIVCGETGSGKTTQLPKICLQQGRGVRGLIGHTQPRRIAARAVASRIGEELGQSQLVGHKIRFQDATSADNLVRVMTDGILLAEAAADPDLLAYDTLIIDEAHERSLNIDFLLGYLKRLLARRPDLKLLITSATIDPDSFSRHFDDAPVIHVGGRSYPVTIEYCPPDEETNPSNAYNAVGEAVQSLWRRGTGAVLVFLPGTRQIRDANRHLRRQFSDDVEILPLYSRLAGTRQNRIFQPSRSGYRIILATNVAETSLTVPGIRYVVDTGTARINRFSPHSGIQRLLIEPVSRASAEQRAGRCGRLGPGICVRLYGEDDYAGRPPFTTPEIRRANLAGVILQMHALALGDIEKFPFIDPPERRAVNAGYRLLEWLGAMSHGRLTDIGEHLAPLPVDPRVGRIALASRGRASQAAVLVLAAALSVQDPRESNMESPPGDSEAPLWHNTRSDFAGLLQIWVRYQNWRHESSRSATRRLCADAGLSYMRMREWESLYRQLCRSLRVEATFDCGDIDGAYADIHQCLLTGLVDHIGMREGSYEYRGPRGRRFHLFPGSGLFSRPPRWVVSAELVKTSRLFARTNARIKPQWLESAAAHLVQKEYASPHWVRSLARATVTEIVSLFGLPLASRTVPLAKVDHEQARWLFIRHALVLGEAVHGGAFFAHNQDLIESIRQREAKLRRPDLLADEERRHEFYDQRTPARLNDMRGFEAWRRRAERESPQCLFMCRQDLLREGGDDVAGDRFPDTLAIGGHHLPLSYALEPGSARDGVSARVPVDLLPELPATAFEWLVPGLLEEKIAALIRSLPKRLRRQCVPVPEFARAVYQALADGRGDLLERLGERLQAMTGAVISPHDFDTVRVPDYLRMHFVVVDHQDAILAEGMDLVQLRQQLTEAVQSRFQQADRAQWERDNITLSDFPDELPVVVELTGPQGVSRGYPAVEASGGNVNMRVFDNERDAGLSHRRGVIWLLLGQASEQTRYIRREVRQRKALLMRYRMLGGGDPADELMEAAANAVFFDTDTDTRSRSALEARLREGRSVLVAEAANRSEQTEHLLTTAATLRERINGAHLPAESRDDLHDQLNRLIYPGFIRATPLTAWARLPVYLQGIALRIDRAQRQPQRDSEQVTALQPLIKDPRAARDNIECGSANGAASWRWQLEELRVALFAQELKARGPTSIRRFHQAMAEEYASRH